MIRETKEELDIDIAPDELKYLGVSTMSWNGRRVIKYMYAYPTQQEQFTVLEGAGGRWCTYPEARELLDDKNGFDEVVKILDGSGESLHQ